MLSMSLKLFSNVFRIIFNFEIVDVDDVHVHCMTTCKNLFKSSDDVKRFLKAYFFRPRT